MLTVAPFPHPQRTDDERALLEVVKTLRRFDWDRFLLGSCTAFHAVVGGLLLSTPPELAVTPGTRPVLGIADQYVWAIVFLAVAAALVSLRNPRPRPVQWATWLAVAFLGGMWLTAFCLAAFRGEGSVVGVVIWPFCYGPWGIVAYRALRKR